MPKIKSAIKKLRQSEKKREENRQVRVKIKTLLDEYKKKPTQKGYSELVSVLDKAAKKNVIHKHKSSRLKSRLAKLLEKK